MALTTAAGFPTSARSANLQVLPVTTAKIGDVLAFSVRLASSSSSVTAVSGGGVSTWTLAVSGNDTSNGVHLETWYGAVASVGAASITATYSASVAGNCELVAAEFSSSLTNPKWSVVASGFTPITVSQTSMPFPSLTSGTSGDQFYWGDSYTGNFYTPTGQTGSFAWYVLPSGAVCPYLLNLQPNMTYQPIGQQPAASYDYSSMTGVIITAISAPSLVQQANTTANSASVIVPLSSSLTSGNTMTAVTMLPAGLRVSSVVDNLNNRWIQAAYSYVASVGGTETWYARGVQPGAASVTLTYSGSGSVTTNIAEWSGLWYVDPLDMWSQNNGVSSVAGTITVTPRTGTELYIGACYTSGIAASITSIPAGYTSLSGFSAAAGTSAVYYVDSGNTAANQSPQWSTAASTGTWATTLVCMVPGASGLNPLLQFPETLVQISSDAQWQNPLLGTSVWNNISSYVRSMDLGPIGRQHELDRVQASQARITVDNRSAVFNPWNTSSFLYEGGYGMDPMSPVKVTAAWNGITYPKFFGYLQSLTPKITDVLNIDAEIHAYDLFQILSLKYLSNNNYAQQVIADGGSNLACYYRLGDPIGSYIVKDSSGNGNTGHVLPADNGPALFGQMGPILYDPSTAVDLTGGVPSQNAYIRTIDNTTQPPITHNPLTSASAWTFECWAKFTAVNAPSAGVSSNVALLSANAAVVPYYGGTNSAHISLELGSLSYIDLNSSATYTINNAFIFNPNGILGYYTYGQMTTNVFDGNWHHFACTLSQAGGVGAAMYVDGEQLTMQSVTTVNHGGPAANGTYASSVTTIGTGSNASNTAIRKWPGWMSDVALYSTTLSATQVANHYSIGTWLQSQEYGAANGGPSAGRLNKILQILGLNPSSTLNVPYPFRTLMYNETNSTTTTSGLNYVQSQTETEPGIIFQNPSGTVNAYSRQYQYLAPSSMTSQGTFADAANVTLHYEGTSLQITTDDLDIWNDIQVQSGRSGAQLQEWGPNQSAAAYTSASIYGPRTMQGLTSLQMQYDSDALAVAQNYGVWYNSPLGRISQITVQAHTSSGNNIPQMLRRGLMDQITVQYTGLGGGQTFTQSSLIEQITDKVDMAGPTWKTTWALSPYEILMKPTILGTYAFGGGVGVLTL